MKLLKKIKFILFATDITGDSMSPVLENGKSYLASCLLKPKVGKIIVFCNPKNFNQVMVKKIIKDTGNGFEVVGFKKGSTSSKEIGIVTPDLVLGVLLKR
jgi:phage repressor protein C with HTH and peptisase S24 domain